MKKLLALLLALMMVFSLAACGGGDDTPSGNEDNPGVSQSDNQGGDTASGKEWPTDLITAWSGSGKIIYVKDNSASGGSYKNYWVVYVDTASMDEFTAYIAELKSAGFAYGIVDGEVEPSDGYDEFEYNYAWNGHTSDGREINVKRYHEPNEGVDENFNTFEYSVQVSLWIRADATIAQSDENSNGAVNEGGNGDYEDTSASGTVAWPENEWTANLPKGADTVIRFENGNSSGIEYFAIYMKWTDEDAKAYGQKLVDAGYATTNGEIVDGKFNFAVNLPEYKVQINEYGETENDYVICIFKI